METEGMFAFPAAKQAVLTTETANRYILFGNSLPTFHEKAFRIDDSKRGHCTLDVGPEYQDAPNPYKSTAGTSKHAAVVTFDQYFE